MLTESCILLEETTFLVVNKPAGILTQAAPGIPSMEVLLRELLAARPDTTNTPFVGLPHRLDRGTSGALLIARNERSLKRFGAQFQSRKIHKGYVAWVEGTIEQEEGTWRDCVRKIPDRPVAEIAPQDQSDAKQAVLHFRCLRRQQGKSLLAIRLETGRMHQIRVQCASRGFSIVGDWCYGSPTRWGQPDARGEWSELALHARSIGFRHPNHAKPVQCLAPFPSRWNEHWEELESIDESSFPAESSSL